MKNTHSLRKKFDDPSQFWSHVHENLDDTLLAANRQLDASHIPFDSEVVAFNIEGKKGNLMRLGCLSKDRRYIRTLSGTVFIAELLKAQPMNIQDVVRDLIAKQEYASIVRVDDGVTITGFLFGDKGKDYSMCVYAINGKIALKDIETRRNVYNKKELVAFKGISSEAKSKLVTAMTELLNGKHRKDSSEKKIKTIAARPKRR